ncbi:hypothetical protein HYFRA_00003766 [Hymenoscyphus fraxineus]|uniref:Uncharacterized protein n=1 Tax=Hymenoscyphus fraxineus TaxID=746836 RepID=A0A9N9KYW4_9HELO|nr:hypothetical protein HYFRA_00003766 [Hymenoscyphus fraxineus]
MVALPWNVPDAPNNQGSSSLPLQNFVLNKSTAGHHQQPHTLQINALLVRSSTLGAHYSDDFNWRRQWTCSPSLKGHEQSEDIQTTAQCIEKHLSYRNGNCYYPVLVRMPATGIIAIQDKHRMGHSQVGIVSSEPLNGRQRARGFHRASSPDRLPDRLPSRLADPGLAMIESLCHTQQIN